MERRLKKLLPKGEFRDVDPKRSKTLRAVRAKDTKPELVVRSLVHRMGLRFRLHRRDLPGRPDIVLPRHRKIIEVHGCFWHMHDCPLGDKAPAKNRAYWREKRLGNKQRDAVNLRELRRLGWRVLVVWECQTMPAKLHALERRLRRFLIC